jgi:hypothetical protein
VSSDGVVRFGSAEGASAARVDAIVLATGYMYRFDFLPAGLLQETSHGRYCHCGSI